MKHLKSITLGLLILTATSLNAQWGKGKKKKGDGNITTIERTTSNYDGISASGSMDFVLVEGNEGNISIKGDSNLLEYIITEVKDDKLVVKTKRGVYLKPTKTIVITIPYESISSVSIAGSGDVKNKGTIKASKFGLAIAGSGDMDLNLSATSVNAAISGSGDITLNGKTDDLKVSIAGSGDVDAQGLNSTNTTVAIAGSGSANVNCDGGDLKVRINGSGDVKYSGNPRTTDNKVSGSGSISG